MDSEFHCKEDDHEAIFWIMLIVLLFFGGIVFLAMRMRIFFKKKEEPENLETGRDLQQSIDPEMSRELKKKK